MSRENVGLALRLYDAFNGRDLEAFLALMHEEAEAGSRLAAVEGEYRGYEGIRRWWNTFLDVLPDYVADPVAVREFGDVTVAELRAEGHGAGSATPITETFWQTAKWQGGKCVWWRNYATEQEALEAVGLRE